MIVQCSNCDKKYHLPEEKISEKGIRVRCKKCGNSFDIKPEAISPHIPKIDVTAENREQEEENAPADFEEQGLSQSADTPSESEDNTWEGLGLDLDFGLDSSEETETSNEAAISNESEPLIDNEAVVESPDDIEFDMGQVIETDRDNPTDEFGLKDEMLSSEGENDEASSQGGELEEDLAVAEERPATNQEENIDIDDLDSLSQEAYKDQPEEVAEPWDLPIDDAISTDDTLSSTDDIKETGAPREESPEQPVETPETDERDIMEDTAIEGAELQPNETVNSAITLPDEEPSSETSVQNLTDDKAEDTEDLELKDNMDTLLRKEAASEGNGERTSSSETDDSVKDYFLKDATASVNNEEDESGGEPAKDNDGEGGFLQYLQEAEEDGGGSELPSEETGDDDETASAEESIAPPEKPKRSKLLIPIIILLLIVAGGMFFMIGGTQKLSGYLGSKQAPVIQEAGRVSLTNLRGYPIKNTTTPGIFVIRGKVSSMSEKPEKIKGIRGVLFDHDGKIIVRQDVSPGKIIPEDKLSSSSISELEDFFKDKSSAIVPPKGSVPFIIIFQVKDYRRLEEFSIEVLR